MFFLFFPNAPSDRNFAATKSLPSYSLKREIAANWLNSLSLAVADCGADFPAGSKTGRNEGPVTGSRQPLNCARGAARFLKRVLHFGRILVPEPFTQNSDVICK